MKKSLAIIALYFLAGIASIVWCNQTAEAEAKERLIHNAGNAYFCLRERL